MVRVQNHNNQLHPKGIYLLRDMVLARAFPDLPPEERPQYLKQIFDNPET